MMLENESRSSGESSSNPELPLTLTEENSRVSLSSFDIDLPPAQSLIGRIEQLGRFTLLAELGRGGQGVVYLAQDDKLGRNVAIKVPGEASQFCTHSRQRLMREARTAATLQHANIAKVYEVGEMDGLLFVVSEFVEGQDLGKWLRARSEPVDIHQAVQLMIPICEAVQHAHSRGILHRDIKPGNVLLTFSADGRPEAPKLTDFGLAAWLLDDDSGDDQEVEEPLSVTGSMVGTPHYMAPELIRGVRRDIGVRADVWGLGCVLFELLTKQRAFDVGAKGEHLSRVLTAPPGNLRKLRSEVHPDLVAICEKCLEKAQDWRYESAAALKHDLWCYSHGLPVSARRLSAAFRSLRWCCRNPLVTL